MLLKEYDWPGNVREFKNVVERLIIMSDETVASSSQISYALGERIKKEVSAIPRRAEELRQLRKEMTKKVVDEIESAFVIDALKRNNWNITKAAEDVGLLRPNFHALMRKHRVTLNRNISD